MGDSEPCGFQGFRIGINQDTRSWDFQPQVVQPVLFINSLVGTMGKISTEDISTYLKRVIVSRFNDYLGENLDTILNLPGQFDELSVELQKRLTLDFAHFGLRLSHLYITSITPPEEVQRAIDDQARMNVITDMEKFVKLKAASAMEKAAENQAEAGAGMGMGIGMMMPAMFLGLCRRCSRFVGPCGWRRYGGLSRLQKDNSRRCPFLSGLRSPAACFESMFQVR